MSKKALFRDARTWIVYTLALFIQFTLSDAQTQCTTDGYSTHHVICGRTQRCEGDNEVSDNAEPHNVRCCSDTEKEGWTKKSKCDVWVASKIDGKCHKNKNFLEAKCICEEAGARLCTKEELEKNCSVGTGCGLDTKLIWTMTGVDMITSSPTSMVATDAPSISPTAAPVPQPTGAPVSNPSISCTEGSGQSSWEALVAFESVTYEVSSTPYVLSVIAEGGAAGDGTQVVSEGQAYGMLAASLALVSLDENDENYEGAKRKFQGYYNGWVKMARKAKPAACQNPTYCDGGQTPCLPGWKYSGDLNNIVGTGSAPDGDEDAIVGMIIAVKAVENDAVRPAWYDEVVDWADRSCTQFLQDDTALSNTGSHRIVKLGSCWGGWDTNGNNPSYHAPGHYRMMRDFQDSITSRTYGLPDFVNRDTWNKVIDTSYKFLETTKCEDTGLVPNWALVREVNGNELQKQQGSFSGSGTPQYEFGAEAGRTMWRVAFDAAAYPEESRDQTGKFLDPLFGKMVENFDPSPLNGWEYFGDASLQACSPIVSNVFGSWQWNTFISAPVYSTLVSEIGSNYFSGKSFNQQDMVDAACGRVSETNNQGYYGLSWQVIGQMTLNGDVSEAGKLFNGSVVQPPITSPTNPPIASPTNPPVASPTNPPIASPTSPPVASPTSPLEFCCTWDLFHCGVDEYCNENASNCHGECGGVWMERDSHAMSCLALYTECTIDTNDCCNELSCVGDELYKQCIPYQDEGISAKRM